MQKKAIEIITMKVTKSTLKNFKHAAALSGNKQYQIAEEASKDILEKISKRIKDQKNKKQ